MDLITLVGNKQLIKITTYFLKNPTVKPTQKELIGTTNIAKATAIKHLSQLVKENILNCKKIGVTNIYSLNNERTIVKELKKLHTILQLNSLHSTEHEEIYLYGSCARGEQTEQSDIDLLIITPEKQPKITTTIEKISRKLKKEINYRIFTPLEWAMTQKKDNAYYTRVEKDKIKLE
jgi:predicted nucleotidyltransferase